jgi:AcrR family transcriptional regulator
VPPRRRRADARRNHDLLVAAAREIFDEQGVDAPLDDVARRAGVGNATLYRHFPTRRDLVVEVYAGEVDALCAAAPGGTSGGPAAAAPGGDPVRALFDWLGAFAAHVAARRYLALAIPEDADGERGRLFDRWHAAMHDTAAALVERARAGGALRAGVTAPDLLALAYGIGLASGDPATVHRLLDLVRRGAGPPVAGAPPGG